MSDTFIKILPVKLTSPEIQAKGEKLADLIGQAQEAKTEAKDRAKSYRESIEILEDEASILASVVRAKAEDREVECKAEKHFERGVIEVVRIDTMETVSTEPMTEEQRQEAIAFPQAVDEAGS